MLRAAEETASALKHGSQPPRSNNGMQAVYKEKGSLLFSAITSVSVQGLKADPVSQAAA